MPKFSVIEADTKKGHFIKAWREGVTFEEQAIEQLKRTARLPFVFKYIAAMPDCHWGQGATVGSVVPTIGAVCPATVGVDIGCGMLAAKLSIRMADIGTASLAALRTEIQRVVPNGRTDNGGESDRGAWHNIPARLDAIWTSEFLAQYELLCGEFPDMRSRNASRHLGTLGTGNHFIELSEDEDGWVWIVLHSGSRGLGNRIGTAFTNLAKSLCERWYVDLEDTNLAFLPQGTPEFQLYNKALQLAQRFAWRNREIMLDATLAAVAKIAPCTIVGQPIHCHHNYLSWERHFGKDVMITRKGAVSAKLDELGIIPGSMGARTYIVSGLGSRDSFHSCSHGAGRAMSRTEARKTFSVEQHADATRGVECHKGAEVIDETPMAYKNIEAVMAAQEDLVKPIHRLKQFLCVKGL